MQTIFTTSSSAQTKKLAKSLVLQWTWPAFRKKALVIGFEGELGSGKTTFIQGAAQAIGIRKRITSPTFVLMKRYAAQKNRSLFHFDCYRLGNPKELLSLGWKEIISNPRNIIFVEWSDRARGVFPDNALSIRFQTISPHKRSISVTIPKLGD